ncbi:MAG TPA: HAD-IIB family hydrolase [Casimicrobiaceae bacterium]|nr:HAD-IIB family hydrolase [Casimicrobiaceae bacterium]
MPEAVRRSIRYVLTDIDDTLTTDGKLTAAAYAALERLHDAGRIVVPVTGRPAGWCDHIARMWPVNAVVGENGAFYMRYERASRKLATRYAEMPTATGREALRARLARIGAEVLAAVPGAALASDQHYRETDLAIDWCEDVPALPRSEVDRIVALLEARSMTVKLSSIHVNAWFGSYDKLSTTRLLVSEAFGEDLDAIRDAVVFAGDSPNDAPMFAYFPNAVGVANLARFLDRVPTPPTWMTTREAGGGFSELADFLLAAPDLLPGQFVP